MRKTLLTFFLLLNGCSWFGGGDGPGLKIVLQAVDHYNRYDEAAYADMFDENVNYFVTNGLGATRFATGKADLKNFNSHVFKIKKNAITVEGSIESGQWVFVQQRTSTPGGTVEASVGYQIKGQKIANMMVVGETLIKKP